MDINPMDILIAIAIIYSFYQGFTKGLIISVASLIGLILGVWGALKFSGYTATYLNETWEIKIPILAFALTFLAILISIYFLGKLLEKVINIMSLGIFNKIGGAIFSAAKMIIILGVLFTIFNKVNSKFQLCDNASIENAIAYSYLNKIENQILPFAEDLLKNSEISSPL